MLLRSHLPGVSTRLPLRISRHSSLRHINLTSKTAVKDEKDRPSPRAIKERLVKIRDMAKKAGNTEHFTIGKAKSSVAANVTKSSTNGTSPATPRKRKPAELIKTEKGDEDGTPIHHLFSIITNLSRGGYCCPELPYPYLFSHSGISTHSKESPYRESSEVIC